MSEHQRCRACGQCWPSYDPTKLSAALWLIFVQLPRYWWHYRFVCPKTLAASRPEE